MSTIPSREPMRDASLEPRSATILIVEDDPDFRNGLADLVRREGHQVETAENGVAALDKLRWGLRPCLILLDLRMPFMTGWEFRNEQQRDGDLADIPVIAMTVGRWKGADYTEFTDLIEKPIDIGHLRVLIARYC
jgi:CheY-like chemotaxis protein